LKRQKKEVGLFQGLFKVSSFQKGSWYTGSLLIGGWPNLKFTKKGAREKRPNFLTEARSEQRVFLKGGKNIGTLKRGYIIRRLFGTVGVKRVIISLGLLRMVARELGIHI